ANPCESCCGKSFATETEASMPESADQAATASSTAAVSASPLEPIRISRASSEEVSSPPSPPLVPCALPLSSSSSKPDPPQAVNTSAPAPMTALNFTNEQILVTRMWTSPLNSSSTVANSSSNDGETASISDDRNGSGESRLPPITVNLNVQTMLR